MLIPLDPAQTPHNRSLRTFGPRFPCPRILTYLKIHPSGYRGDRVPQSEQGARFPAVNVFQSTTTTLQSEGSFLGMAQQI